MFPSTIIIFEYSPNVSMCLGFCFYGFIDDAISTNSKIFRLTQITIVWQKKLILKSSTSLHLHPLVGHKPIYCRLG